jgi:hypothetical protein
MEGYLEIFGRKFCGKKLEKKEISGMEKEIIFLGVETLV